MTLSSWEEKTPFPVQFNRQKSESLSPSSTRHRAGHGCSQGFCSPSPGRVLPTCQEAAGPLCLPLPLPLFSPLPCPALKPALILQPASRTLSCTLLSLTFSDLHNRESQPLFGKSRSAHCLGCPSLEAFPSPSFSLSLPQLISAMPIPESQAQSLTFHTPVSLTVLVPAQHLPHSPWRVSGLRPTATAFLRPAPARSGCSGDVY